MVSMLNSMSLVSLLTSTSADLKKIYFETAKQSAASRNGAAEPLEERFALFTEKYLAKVAEAEDAGRPIKECLVMWSLLLCAFGPALHLQLAHVRVSTVT